MILDSYDIDTAHDCHECAACGETHNDEELSAEQTCPDCVRCAWCDECVSTCGPLDESGHCLQCIDEAGPDFVENVDIYGKNAREAESLRARHEWTVKRLVEWVEGSAA